MNIFPKVPPSPDVLRKLLERLALTQSDFDRFLTDYLPEARLTVPSGVGLKTQFNALLSENLNAAIWAALCQGYPRLLEETRALWATQTGQPLSTPERARLQGDLDTLLSARQVLVTHGRPTQDIDALIAEKRAELKRSSSLYPGQLLGGRFQLLQFLGKGGMAEVWLALDRHPAEPAAEERRVALKILHSHHHHHTDPARERFRRGAYLMWQFKHAHIVHVRAEPQDADGYLFFPMDYLSGGTLDAKVKSERLTIDTLLRYFMEITDALHYAHTTVVTIDGQSTYCKAHRDISPWNILFDENGVAYLIDFDMASLNSQFSSDGQGGRGPLSYAAPECLSQTQKLTPDCRADVFSLALVMLFALTQREVSLEDRTGQILELIAQLPYNARVREVFTRALEKDRERRFPSVEAFRSALVPAFASAAVRPTLSDSQPPAPVALPPPPPPVVPRSVTPPAASPPVPSLPLPKAVTPRAPAEPRRARWLVLVPTAALVASISYGHSKPAALRQARVWLANVLVPPPTVSGSPGDPAPTLPPEAAPKPFPAPPEAAPLDPPGLALCPEPAGGPTESSSDEPPLPSALPAPPSSSLASSLVSFGASLSSSLPSFPLSLPPSLLPSLLPSSVPVPLPWSLAPSLAPVLHQQGELLAALWWQPEPSTPLPSQPQIVGPSGPSVAPLVGAAARKGVAWHAGRMRSPASAASHKLHDDLPEEPPAKPFAFVAASLYDEQIHEAAARLSWCKCFCLPKSRAAIVPPEDRMYRVVFDMETSSSTLQLNRGSAAGAAYQISSRCVADEIHKSLPTIPFPHSTGTLTVGAYCVGLQESLPICSS